MTKITYSPISELVVHEVLEMNKDDLLRSRVTPSGTMPLYWCDGVLFNFSSLPMSDDVTRDYLGGKIHWAEVQYAPMKDYVPVLTLSEEEYKTTMNVRILDTGFSNLHQEFAKWLKDNYLNAKK